LSEIDAAAAAEGRLLVLDRNIGNKTLKLEQTTQFQAMQLNSDTK
jgi:hypothetical protein